MDEKEKIVLIETILSFVEEIHEGKKAPGPVGIAMRLKHYDGVYDKFAAAGQLPLTR